MWNWWLTLQHKFQFKTLTFTFKIFHNDAPMYLQNLINRYHPNRALSSSTTLSLVPNRNKTVRYGKGLMDTSAAVLWNSLPNNIKQAENLLTFKKLLKHYITSLWFFCDIWHIYLFLTYLYYCITLLFYIFLIVLKCKSYLAPNSVCCT